jgi:hypothetical protein
MAPLDLFNHFLNFVAPAFGVGFVCALVGRVAMRQTGQAPAWWIQGAVNSVIGIAVLVAGLLLTGHDGRMATYAALAVACGTSQWLLSAGWR